LYNVKSPVVERISDKAGFYWSCRGEVLPYLKAKATSAYNTTREYAVSKKPSRAALAWGVIATGAMYELYRYITAPAKKEQAAVAVTTVS
jgi:hypothetical protein